MKEIFNKFLKYVILPSIAVLFIYLTFRDKDLSELIEVLKRTNYVYAIAGALIGTIGGSYIRALRWKYFLEPIKKDISISPLFNTVLIGYFLNIILGRAGDVTRPVLLAKKEEISRASVFGTIIVERIIDALSMLIVFGLCLFSYRIALANTFGELNIEYVTLYTSIIILGIVGVIFIMIFNIEKTDLLIEKFTAKILPEKYSIRVHRIMVSLLKGFVFMRYPSLYFKIFITSTLLWCSYIFSTYITFFAFGINLNIFDANLLLTMTTVAQILPVPANGAGVYHYFCTSVLSGIFKVDGEVALGFATVTHILSIACYAVFGLISLSRYNYKNILNKKGLAGES